MSFHSTDDSSTSSGAGDGRSSRSGLRDELNESVAETANTQSEGESERER